MPFADILPFPWPLTLNPFVLFGMLLLIGLVAGEFARRFRLPTITGYIIIGFVLGPGVVGVFDADLLDAAKPLTNVALALVLFQIGRLLDVRAMLLDRALLWTSAAESIVGCLLVFVVMRWGFGLSALISGVIAAIGVSSSPAVLFVVAKELDAKGPLTTRVLNLVALNNVIAFLLFTALLPSLLAVGDDGAANLVLRPTWQLLGALLLAWSVTYFKLFIAHFVGKGEPNQFALSLGAIIFALGIASMLQISILLTLLGLGILSTNLDRSGALTEVQFGHLASVFFVILFVVSGANLHADDLGRVGLVAGAFVLARVAGKWLGAAAGAWATDSDRRTALLLGLPLVPMASLAIGLVELTKQFDHASGETVAAIVFGAIAICETIGPIASEFALRRAGEVAPDATIDH